MTDITPELAQRMEALVRKVATYSDRHRHTSELFIAAEEARDIVAGLPEPVDPDVLVVRAILHAHQRASIAPHSGWGNMSYAKGSYDNYPQFQAALEAYRALEREGR